MRYLKQLSPMTDADKARFESKISKDTDSCWHWTAYTNRKGYGVFSIRHRLFQAHRMAYLWAYGNDPGPMLVLHKCDTPSCVNPNHLFLGTDDDNVKDRDRKGRCNPARGEANGSHTKPDRVPRGDRSGPRLHPECMVRGEHHPHSKLTDDAVRAIRLDTRPHHVIAAAYGVSRSTVQRVKYGRHWKHVGTNA